MGNGRGEEGGAVRPTLFLGLGGTGKEVLLRLRRKFYEKFGVPGLPCTAFLWVDTDTHDHMAQGEKMDEIFRAVSFETEERFPLLEGRVGKDMADIFSNKSRWDHVHRWLYHEVERYGTEIADGAGGVRAVGRLSFFYRYGGRDGLMDRLNRILGTKQLKSHEVIDDTEEVFRKLGYEIGVDLEFDPEPQVFLICSVAGGTGAGTLLDTAFLLKHLKLANRIYGTVFLPNVYYSTAVGEVAQRSHANGYASLKELEFYTLRRRSDSTGGQEEDISVDFDVEWEKGERHKAIAGPPLTVSYILESNNEGGIGLKTRTELFQMAAESLFLDFMPGTFSTAKRSHYSNVTQYLSGLRGVSVEAEDVTLAQHFARRYATFGMSKLEIPADLLKRACAAHLARDIVQQVWGRSAADSNIRSAVLEDMARGERTLTADGLANRFGGAWQDQVRQGIARIFRGASLKAASDVDELEDGLREFERAALRKEGSDPTRWGTVIAEIRSRKTPVQRELESDLLAWLKRICAAPGRGPRALAQENGYLRNLVSNLKDYCEFDQDRKPALVRKKEEAERDAELWRKAADSDRNELKRALGGWALKGLAQQAWTVQVLTERWRDNLEQAALAEASAVLYEETTKVCSDAVEFLEGQRPGLERFLEVLDAMAAEFDRRRDGCLDFRESVLFIRVYKHEKDWASFYYLGVDETGKPQPVDPSAQSTKYLEEKLGAGSTVWELVGRLPVEGRQGLESDLMAFCERQFIEDFDVNSRQVDVLDHEQVKNRLDEYVNKMVRCALPMVRVEPKLGSKSVQSERRCYLGIGREGGALYKDFVQKLSQLLEGKGYPLTAVLTTGRPWEVYLYMVSYAFPLPALTAVREELHPAYYAFYRSLKDGKIGEQKLQIPLHLSKQWEGRFDDLVVFSDSEARETQEALEVMLFGSALRVLDSKEINGQLDYGYRIWIPPASQRKSLGNRREAIEGLRSDATLRLLALEEIKRREGGLGERQLLRYYWLLSYLSLSSAVDRRAPERGLLDKKLARLGERLAATAEVEGLNLENIPASDRAEEALKRAGKEEILLLGTLGSLRGLEPWVAGRTH